MVVVSRSEIANSLVVSVSGLNVKVTKTSFSAACFKGFAIELQLRMPSREKEPQLWVESRIPL